MLTMDELNFIQDPKVPKGYIKESIFWSAPCTHIRDAFKSLTQRANPKSSEDIIIGVTIIAFTKDNKPKFIAYGTKCFPDK